MTQKYLRLTVADVQYLVELLDEADRCSGDHACANRREFSTLMIRMDDFLITSERKGQDV